MRGAKILSSSRFASSSVYWYWVLVVRPPTLTSCLDCKNRLIPSTFASLGLRRLMISSALFLRGGFGLSWMYAAPGFPVEPLLPPP